MLQNNILVLTSDYKAYVGRDNLKFYYVHSADEGNRIDASASNIIDTYLHLQKHTI